MDAPDIRNRIEADLRRAQSERAALLGRIGPLDDKIERLTATLSVLDEYSPNGSARIQVGSRSDDGRPSSLKDAAIEVITSTGEPVSVPDIADAILKMDFGYESDRDTLERSLRGIISRAHREGQIGKVARGLYGPPSAGYLTEESPEAAGAASGVAGPPAGFKGG